MVVLVALEKGPVLAEPPGKAPPLGAAILQESDDASVVLADPGVQPAGDCQRVYPALDNPD